MAGVCGNQSIQKLRNREIDLALIEGNCDTCELGSVILDTDYLTVAVSSDSVWGKKGMILPEELLKEKLILKPKQSGTRRLLESGLRSVGMEPEKLHVIMEVDNIDTQTDKKRVGHIVDDKDDLPHHRRQGQAENCFQHRAFFK